MEFGARDSRAPDLSGGAVSRREAQGEPTGEAAVG